MFKYIYKNIVLKYPIYVLSIVFSFLIVFAYYASKIEIDASAETLLLQNDKDLEYSRLVNKRYITSDSLVITYNHKNGLLSKESILLLKNISKDLMKINAVESITSILTLPLLLSSNSDISSLLDNIQTLENTNLNKNLIKNEFIHSPLYKNTLVSKDFKTSAIIVNLHKDKKYFLLLNKRNFLINKELNNNLSSSEKLELINIKQEFKDYRKKIRENDHQTILKIREILFSYKHEAELFLGGVNMISDDIITFVKSDLEIYGSSLVLIFTIVLFFIFRQIRWVLIPLSICFLSVITTAGTLGFFAWEITVISSNFIALQLIITMSIVLHLIVRYEELKRKYTKSSNKRLILATMLSKLKPTFFAIMTTIAGFISLILADIKPIINLGLMMSIGIFLSLILSFIIFPAFLVLLKKNRVIVNKKLTFTNNCAQIVKNDKKFIYLFTFVVIIISLLGIKNLIVENSFISYFKKDTQIYKSMIIIDKELGGTTPLDVILKFKDIKIKDEIQSDDEDDFDSEFTDDANNDEYWFTQEKMDKIIKVHNYLSSLSEVGSVQSFANILETAKILNKSTYLDSFKLALLYKQIPNEYKSILFSPYINIENNEVRFTLRIIDSNESLRRNDFIKKVRKDLSQIVNNDEIRLTSIMILYNNMLQSLFSSQIKTLFFVVILLFFMFLILFRSFKIAFIAIFSNIVPVSVLFAFMGFFSIPLDIMTITIAAISIGIGVDHTIHYIHRFKEEYLKDKSYKNAMMQSHNTIAHAMVYTTLIIILGFSIMLLSNLLPSVYFAGLTILIMITILSSSLFLLPKLLISFKIMNK